MDLITVNRKAGKSFELRVRGHAVTVDMSKEEGGADEGMNPVELLSGSLAAFSASSLTPPMDIPILLEYS